MENKRLFLLDGHALVYRAHYAFISRPLINSKGINTSAITGFVRSLMDILKNQKPTHIAVAFDPKGGTFRNELYPEYKANRDAQPEDITIAFPYIRKIVEGFNIPIIEVANYEADDTIGTIAKKAEKEGFTVYMVTPDKDYAQLVSENIFIYKPARMGNGIDILGVPEVLDKWDIERVDQVIDVLGLQGDSVDNIPGIPGIGAKTAVKLLKLFGDMEGILANTDQLKGKQKEKVEAFAEQGRLSKVLATISLDVPIDFDAADVKVEPINKAVLTKVFEELEFRTIAQQVLGIKKTPKVGEQGVLFGPTVTSHSASESKMPKSEMAPEYSIAKESINTQKHKYELLDTPEEILKLANDLLKVKAFCFDTETSGLNVHFDDLVGIAFSYKKGEGYYIPVPKNRTAAKAILAPFIPIFKNNEIVKIGQNLKFDMNMLYWYGIDVKGPFFDTMIAHYLLEPELRHKLDYLAESYLNYKMVPIEELLGKKGKNQKSMADLDAREISDYAAEDADITYQLRDVLAPKLEEEELTTLFDTIEMPLINVLADIECAGVKINEGFLKEYSVKLGKEIKKMEIDIFEKAGGQFNIASPKQVGEVLFERLKIPYRWTKTSSGQYSTNEEKLNELSVNYDVVNDILKFRKYSKLKSTYVDSLPNLINPKTGLIHSSFNQARAATGRLSSENPNLQNIPIKDEAGREIRKAFVPRDSDHILLAADYSQIELRLIAEIANEEEMLKAFIAGHDIHRATAAGVYNVPIEDVTSDQRRNAKTVNFSIIYGAGSTNLSRQLGIKRGEAKELIEQYFKTYSGLKIYMDKTVKSARQLGYVMTLMGRKRYLRDINSRNRMASSNAERMAINTPIQGSAADMIKIAMINIHIEMKEKSLKSKMIMQVHDELVFDVFRPELDDMKVLVEKHMRGALPNLKVPILVGMDVGANWLEAH
ncbi:MAG: DNA polymerase I [Saprospiraceae bacterium]